MEADCLCLFQNRYFFAKKKCILRSGISLISCTVISSLSYCFNSNDQYMTNFHPVVAQMPSVLVSFDNQEFPQVQSLLQELHSHSLHNILLLI